METSPALLNAQNPDAITYQTDELGFTILGGIRLDSLDRLRVTLKVEVINRQFKHYLNHPDLAALAIRHNIDLYNDTQVEKLVRKTAERLEIGITNLTKAVAGLVNELEAYRLERIQQQTIKAEVKKQLTEDEVQAATAFLQQPCLLERTNEAIGQSGLIGEELNRLLMYLIFTSRKREHPLHVVSLGSSGTGKTYLQEKVGELIPEEEKMEITVLSENAFYYFGQQELKHKLILIEDLDGLSGTGANGAFYAVRELQSKKRISKTVAHKDTRGNTKTVHLTVEGPVSVAGCTTRESIYEDNANRSFLIYLDESKEQDERIMQYQRAESAGRTNKEAERTTKLLLQNTQRILQPVTVRNPYAELLQLPLAVFKPRRTNSHYLQFIEAITFYHQHQREQKVDEVTGELYIETTLEDIQAANKLLKETLLRKSDELSGACRNFFESLKMYLIGQHTQVYTSREVRRHMRLPGTTFRRYQNELLSCGYVKVQSGKKALGYQYEIVSYNDYNNLKQGIDSILDEALKNISNPGLGRAGVPQVSHAQNGSPNPNKTSAADAASYPQTQQDKVKKVNEAAQQTLACITKAADHNPDKTFTPDEVSQLTGRNKRTENRYLKELYDAGLLTRKADGTKYTYRIS